MFAVRFPASSAQSSAHSSAHSSAWPRKVYIQRGYATPSSDGVEHRLYDLVCPDHEHGWWRFDRRDKTLSHWMPDYYGISRCLQLFRDVDEAYIDEWWNDLYS